MPKGGVEPVEELAEKAAGVSDRYFATVLTSLADDGLVSGISVTDYIDGSTGVIFRETRLTLAGAEYLSENAMMAKARKLAGTAFEAAVASLVRAANMG
ncbi:YjcQ family protein [Collinsella sp. AGMB00827]|uniref:YjcQ family protein n=1 Tax=Collinsella ureilytica TaxID=2869515 RepID=A0ABS7MLF5_9ACTN|nr:YjcQ family protein [Collinsella urealyticum]